MYVVLRQRKTKLHRSDSQFGLRLVRESENVYRPKHWSVCGVDPTETSALLTQSSWLADREQCASGSIEHECRSYVIGRTSKLQRQQLEIVGSVLFSERHRKNKLAGE